LGLFSFEALELFGELPAFDFHRAVEPQPAGVYFFALGGESAALAEQLVAFLADRAPLDGPMPFPALEEPLAEVHEPIVFGGRDLRQALDFAALGGQFASLAGETLVVEGAFLPQFLPRLGEFVLQGEELFVPFVEVVGDLLLLSFERRALLLESPFVFDEGGLLRDDRRRLDA